MSVYFSTLPHLKLEWADNQRLKILFTHHILVSANLERTGHVISHAVCGGHKRYSSIHISRCDLSFCDHCSTWVPDSSHDGSGVLLRQHNRAQADSKGHHDEHSCAS